ncbi:MAG: TetR/AcrR family transcriptional regulator C-terminal domain-containing protein [Eubacteriales bacterium]|nr:TetR/AcrR family transcriptional regulator C-terminal domain-containing protein [Eubacteriales bacterium]
MPNHETPASHRTKEVIAASLKKLMETKPLTKISVREVIEDCNINRGTFYYHFQDIYELVKWMLDEEAINFLKSYTSLLTYEEAIRFVLDYVRNNKYIAQCSFDTFGYYQLKQFFHKDIHDTVKNTISEISRGKNISDAYLDFLANFYTFALVNLLLEWVQTGMKEDNDTIVRHVKTMVSGNIELALKNAEEMNC